MGEKTEEDEKMSIDGRKKHKQRLYRAVEMGPLDVIQDEVAVLDDGRFAIATNIQSRNGNTSDKRELARKAKETILQIREHALIRKFVEIGSDDNVIYDAGHGLVEMFDREFPLVFKKNGFFIVAVGCGSKTCRICQNGGFHYLAWAFGTRKSVPGKPGLSRKVVKKFRFTARSGKEKEGKLFRDDFIVNYGKPMSSKTKKRMRQFEKARKYINKLIEPRHEAERRFNIAMSRLPKVDDQILGALIFPKSDAEIRQDRAEGKKREIRGMILTNRAEEKFLRAAIDNDTVTEGDVMTWKQDAEIRADIRVHGLEGDVPARFRTKPDEKRFKNRRYLENAAGMVPRTDEAFRLPDEVRPGVAYVLYRNGMLPNINWAHKMAIKEEIARKEIKNRDHLPWALEVILDGRLRDDERRVRELLAEIRPVPELYRKLVEPYWDGSLAKAVGWEMFQEIESLLIDDELVDKWDRRPPKRGRPRKDAA